MMYYECPACGKKFMYELDLLNSLGPQFGICPKCGAEGKFVKDGPREGGHSEYEEVTD